MALLQIIALIMFVVGLGNLFPVSDSSEPIVGIIFLVVSVGLWIWMKSVHKKRIRETAEKLMRGDDLGDEDKENVRYLR